MGPWLVRMRPQSFIFSIPKNIMRLKGLINYLFMRLLFFIYGHVNNILLKHSYLEF